MVSSLPSHDSDDRGDGSRRVYYNHHIVVRSTKADITTAATATDGSGIA